MRSAGYKEREPGSLKEAVAELVANCGGQVAVSQFLRVSKSQIHRYTDDSDENQFTHMPVDLVARLERHCGDPVVTRWLAAAAGFAVIDIASGPPHEPYHQVLGRIGRESGELFAEGCKQLAAGRHPKDIGRLKREALRVVRACCELIGELHSGP